MQRLTPIKTYLLKMLFLHTSMAMAVPTLILSLEGCSAPEDSAAASSTTTVTAPSGGSPALSVNNFYVDIKTTAGALRYIHDKTSWSRGCYVDFNDTVAANRNIECVVETTELDLMHLGMELNYNIPPYINCTYLA